MAAWAYRCRLCADDGHEYFVPAARVAELAPDVTIVRVRLGRAWRCARIDRSRRVAVAGLLLHELVPTDARDCGQCTDP